MPNPTNVDVGCRIIPEYVEEATIPIEPVNQSCEIQRPAVVASYLEEENEHDFQLRNLEEITTDDSRLNGKHLAAEEKRRES